MSVATKTIETKIPARMDRLPWSRWHWLVILALGTVWILDGLEVTIKGAVGPSLKEALGFSTFGVAGLASIYLLGAVSGALFWGYLTDRFGRKNLFLITIAVYMVGVIGTSITGLWIFGEGYEYLWFGVFRFVTGFGIGGEYAAINSAIDELIPARVRGWTALAINGSYWIGTAFGAVFGAVYLNILPQDEAFRAAFGMGLILAIGISLLRLYVPESPRWLMTHGYEDEAEETIDGIEEDVREYTGKGELPDVPDEDAITLRERRSVGFIELGRTLFSIYPRRSISGFTILVTQAFLYNAIFFTFGLMLTTFFAVSNASVGWFLIPFAVGNFLGPLVLGRWFDSAGRKVMIPLTFGIAGVLTILTGFLFATDVIEQAWLMTAAWVVIFFFASAGASSGYLTVSETFPLEVRAMAIAFFYAIATAAGGILGPALYGALISSNDQWSIFYGYAFGGVLMLIGAIVHRAIGIEAAQMELEDVAAPLSAEEEGGAEGAPEELEGPAGINPADPESVREFQREHGVHVDGVLGPETAGALRAELGANGERGEIGFIDLTDPDSVRAFQEEHGLEVDGLIGPVTRGAIHYAYAQRTLDPADEDAIREFQRGHSLSEDGEEGLIGPQTQAALRAVRSERDPEGNSGAFIRVDPLDGKSVERFQRSVGLEVDGCIGPETRGALLAQRAVRRRNAGIDPADEGSIRRFQEEHQLRVDGVIGERTRTALLDTRKKAHGEEQVFEGFGVDPVRPDSVRRFQRAVGLEEDACIGPETRRALRQAPHLLIDLDPTDEESVKRFQRQHDLADDGVIGPHTQGALATVIRRKAGDQGLGEDAPQAAKQAAGIEGLLALDPSDHTAISDFQEKHGLAADGVIGPQTRAALRAALSEEERTMIRREPGPGRRYPDRLSTSGAPVSAYLPHEDREFDVELGEILDTLAEHGALDAGELRKRTDARLWGPGRFRYVLKTAVEEGVLRRVGRNRYAPA